MRKSFRKSLSIFLMLMLGLSPLQSVLASAFSASATGQTAHVKCMPDCEMMSSSADRTCAQCDDNHACAATNCAVSMALAILPQFDLPTPHTVISKVTLVDDSFESKITSSLFRPPKA